MMIEKFDNEWWEASWRNRMNALKAVFGETIPQDQVRTFHFSDPSLILPGACAVSFRNAICGAQLTTSLGLSQPLSPQSTGNAWEFGVYAPPGAEWPSELIYDLVLGYIQYPGWLSEGHWLPLTFFNNQNGALDCGSFDARSKPYIHQVGNMRGLYLWRDMQHRQNIETEGRCFSLMIATGITSDEEQAGDATSPPHILLLLQEVGIGQVTDPHRRSAFEMAGAEDIWNKIKVLSHDDVVRKLSCDLAMPE